MLYNYSRELKSFRNNADAQDFFCLKHLNFLIDFIQIIYKFTTQRFLSFLTKSEIIYNLLWALIKSNSILYTICLKIYKLRCIIYNCDEEKKTNSELKYFNMKCHYLNYDDQVFEKISINISIVKFREKKRINTFKNYSLRYHLNEKKLKIQFVEHDRKFIFMLEIDHRHCRDMIFYIKNRKIIKIFVDNRIMLDTFFFSKNKFQLFQIAIRWVD